MDKRGLRVSELSGPDHIVGAEPCACEPASGITEFDEDGHIGVEAHSVSVAPLFTIGLPYDAGQDGDLAAVRPPACFVAIQHILIVRYAAGKVNRVIGHVFDYE